MGSHNYKKLDYFACSKKWTIRHQLPLYCHNLVEMWLNRLPMTPRFSVSSKEDSDVEGCSVSPSVDICDIIVVSWVLDLVSYGCVCWGVVKPLVGFFTIRVGRMVSGAGLDGISLPCVFWRLTNCCQFTLVKASVKPGCFLYHPLKGLLL